MQFTEALDAARKRVQTENRPAWIIYSPPEPPALPPYDLTDCYYIRMDEKQAESAYMIAACIQPDTYHALPHFTVSGAEIHEHTPQDYDSAPAQLELIADLEPIKKEGKKLKRLQDKIAQMTAEYNAALQAEKTIIARPADAAQLVSGQMSALTQEELWLILLNTRNRVLEIVPVYRGSGNSSNVAVGELFKFAILRDAKAMILCHNHPSGDPAPSPDDAAVTRAIVNAGKLLDIEILDHLVIGGRRFVSMKERGLGFS